MKKITLVLVIFLGMLGTGYRLFADDEGRIKYDDRIRWDKIEESMFGLIQLPSEFNWNSIGLGLGASAEKISGRFHEVIPGDCEGRWQIIIKAINCYRNIDPGEQSPEELEENLKSDTHKDLGFEIAETASDITGIDIRTDTGEQQKKMILRRAKLCKTPCKAAHDKEKDPPKDPECREMGDREKIKYRTPIGADRCFIATKIMNGDCILKPTPTPTPTPVPPSTTISTPTPVPTPTPTPTPSPSPSRP